jgi:hypothetical protein
MHGNGNCPVTFRDFPISNFNEISREAYGIQVEVHLLAILKYALLWMSAAENHYYPTIVMDVIHIEFKRL